MFLINGCTTDLLPVQDRGLQYGDGVFETIALYEGQPLCWEAHYARLSTGCQRLGISCPEATLLFAEAVMLIKNDQRAVLKIIITRGCGGRGYKPPAEHTPTRILALYPWPDYSADNPEQGIRVRYCQTRLGDNSSLAGIKHLNRLEQVLARAEWDDPHIAEGLMCDRQGNIIEGTMSNLFVIVGNTLITPDVNDCGIAGVIRGCILDLAPSLGMHIRISPISRSILSAVDEVFMCNSIIGVWPVIEIEGKKQGTGEWTRKIRSTLFSRAAIVP